MKLLYKYVIDGIPPSNNKYQGTGGKGKAFRYQEEKREWEMKVRVAVGRNKPKEPLSGVIVKHKYYFGDRRRRDPDNYSGKFLNDGLVLAGVIEDDSFNHIQLLTEGGHDKENPRVETYIYKEE